MGQLVGAGSATPLATIVQLAPIYVNFAVSEKDVLSIRAGIRARGITAQDLKKIPVEVGLQSETGYPHSGTLDYAAPNITAATGTLAVRAVLPNADRQLLPGLFRARARSARATAGHAARAGPSYRQRPERPLSAGRQQGRRGRAAYG